MAVARRGGRSRRADTTLLSLAFVLHIGDLGLCRLVVWQRSDPPRNDAAMSRVAAEPLPAAVGLRAESW